MTGVESVLVPRFHQLQKAHRKHAVRRKLDRTASGPMEENHRFMDGHVFQPDTAEHRDFLEALVVQNDQLRHDAAAQPQLAAQMATAPPPAVVLFGQEEALDRWQARKRSVHRGRFPISDRLVIFMTIVQADLIEQRRERWTSHGSWRNYAASVYF